MSSTLLNQLKIDYGSFGQISVHSTLDFYTRPGRKETNVPLKCGFLKESFIMNACLVSCPFPVIHFWWVCCCTHPKRMTGNGQLTRGAFIINDFLRNPDFKGQIMSKGLLVSSNSPKNKRTNSFLLLWRIRSFVFWENVGDTKKKSFRNYLTFSYITEAESLLS